VYILGIVGSKRKGGNTDILIQHALSAAEDQGMATKRIYLSDYKIDDCTGCEQCRTSFTCAVKDGMQDIYPLIESADAIVIGSPTYFYNVTGIVKNFLDRLYCYELFDESDRSVWLGRHEVAGIKYAATIAVCEQADEENMGYTSLVLGKSLAAVGYRVVAELKAFHAFAKGDILHNHRALDEATTIGKRLAKILRLRCKAGNIINKDVTS